ncbi:uncharacterized protein BDZ83DRAFT_635741 [Colletotrichum acutatum]|uniref:Uncharacterized protein n=1 Tax=Glomerella acutata TaxID=27357 RepID=A0AAD8UGM0_GLOAC|nr:uncharacterized protein BDZ83DRAFT_635741 [Colletotrichum acutatum]KAK1715506.1 hypothetical protein BDZ83DRAFT_635741 [Colletotrichum acutatum]
MNILLQLSLLLGAASVVSAGCSACPLGSGRCTDSAGKGCRKGEIKYQWLVAQNYCCREPGFETVKCWSAC